MVWVGSQGKLCQGSEAALAPQSVTCSRKDPVFFPPSPDLSGERYACEVFGRPAETGGYVLLSELRVYIETT